MSATKTPASPISWYLVGCIPSALGPEQAYFSTRHLDDRICLANCFPVHGDAVNPPPMVMEETAAIALYTELMEVSATGSQRQEISWVPASPEQVRAWSDYCGLARTEGDGRRWRPSNPTEPFSQAVGLGPGVARTDEVFDHLKS